MTVKSHAAAAARTSKASEAAADVINETLASTRRIVQNLNKVLKPTDESVSQAKRSELSHRSSGKTPQQQP